ncbi:chromodomain Y [Sigmodon hispidus]
MDLVTPPLLQVRWKGLLLKGKTRKEREYLVRWKGYESEDDTWEPGQHLVNCEEYIHCFNQCHSERQKEGSLAGANRASPQQRPEADLQGESPEKLDSVEQGPEDTIAPEVTTEKPIGALLGPGVERARMGSRPRIHPLVPQVSGPVTAAMATGLAVNGKENNSLNPEVMKKVQSALSTAAADDSKLVLLSAVGSVFSCGLDFIYFIRCLTDDRKMADAIRNFVNTFIQFKKPIIVAVNGPAIGLGASILPLCDVVWANEKAWFQTPYTTFGQSPDGCSTVMFPKIMGGASANEMLLSGRTLTTQEACGKGLVSRVFWPRTFTQEVMVSIKELASCNPVVLEESKALVRCNMKLELEQANE